ncbi:hypothetical protein FQZ97_1275850 [compost metagenome]
MRPFFMSSPSLPVVGCDPGNSNRLLRAFRRVDHASPVHRSRLARMPLVDVKSDIHPTTGSSP